MNEDTLRYFDYNKDFARTGPGGDQSPEAYQTKLTAGEETLYKKWIKTAREDTGTDLDPDDPSYDMRGYWKERIVPQGYKRMGKGQHFVDTYKTPYHPFFSRESKYALPTAPYWSPSVPLRGGATDALIDPNTGEPTPAFMEEVGRGESINAARDQLWGK